MSDVSMAPIEPITMIVQSNIAESTTTVRRSLAEDLVWVEAYEPEQLW